MNAFFSPQNKKKNYIFEVANQCSKRREKEHERGKEREQKNTL